MRGRLGIHACALAGGGSRTFGCACVRACVCVYMHVRLLYYIIMQAQSVSYAPGTLVPVYRSTAEFGEKRLLSMLFFKLSIAVRTLSFYHTRYVNHSSQNAFEIYLELSELEYSLLAQCCRLLTSQSQSRTGTRRHRYLVGVAAGTRRYRYASIRCR